MTEMMISISFSCYFASSSANIIPFIKMFYIKSNNFEQPQSSLRLTFGRNNVHKKFTNKTPAVPLTVIESVFL
jgi:hypothetical protein